MRLCKASKQIEIGWKYVIMFVVSIVLINFVKGFPIPTKKNLFL